MKMIKAEFENIAKHKLLTATICAIMIIPFLYSVFFLKSVWDPYGNTGHLPVAVVNKDQSVRFQGKNFAVGDQLVDKLKENEDLDWHFVSAKKARYGLGHKKYYMVITIPENFSKNATTVLNKKPKKMELTYKTNDSLNYIGAVISKQGATKVDASVKESVSEAYADTMFKVIKKVGGGFKTAANGAKKLSDGSKTLSDGLNTYTAGVDTVNKGVMTLNAGVVPLGSGVLQLTTGSSTLKNGIDTYTAGVDKVNGGVQTLKGSVPALTSGVGQLYTGSNALTSGLNELKSNSKALNDGAGQLSSGLKKADDELKVLSTKEAQEQLKQVNSHLKQLPELAKEADSLLGDTNISNLQTLLQAGETLGKINLNPQQLLISINALKDSNLQNAVNSLTPDQIKQLKTQIDGIDRLLGQYSTIESSIVGLQNTIIPNIKLNGQQLTIEQIQTGLQNKSLAVALMNGTATVTSESSFGAAVNTVLQETRSGKIPQANFVDVMGATLQAQGAVLAKQANYFKPIQAVLGNTQLDANSIAQIKNQLSMVSLLLDKANDIKFLMNTANQIDSSDIQTLLSAKSVMESQDFKNQTAKLDAVLKNKDEISAFRNQLKVLENQEMINGLSNQLNKVPSMVSQLHEGYVGSNKLVAGIGQYTAGVGSAAYGSQRINAGLGQLNGKVPALSSGVNQLASGTSQLAANSGALRSGAGQLASGLGQLNSQVPTLTDGVSQLAAGTSKLAANSGKLDKGATDVHKGNKKLASALKGGADTVTKLKLGSANASMFASPTKLKEKHYSYVPNYGYALAPYMLSVALFVGCLVFNLVYPIRRISTEDGSATEWFFSKVAIGSLVATGNALVETLLMMACGLHPNHPVQMIVNAVSFSFTAMFLIMFMSMAFGNPGRFISMILLVIQLGSCGGSFPIEITRGMNGFFQAINPYLPMTYSVYGFREALTSGLGENQVLHSVLIQLIFIAAFLILLYVTMRIIRPEQEFHEEMESEYPGN